MKVLVNIEGSKDDLKLVLQMLRDNMDYAEAQDIFRLYMRDNEPNGVILEEHYDENENLIEKREH